MVFGNHRNDVIPLHTEMSTLQVHRQPNGVQTDFVVGQLTAVVRIDLADVLRIMLQRFEQYSGDVHVWIVDRLPRMPGPGATGRIVVSAERHIEYAFH